MTRGTISEAAIDRFVETVIAQGRALYRDFPWRRTHDPYALLVSEVMLQQTQVTRVVPYFESWMRSFPTLESLAAAPLEAVLREWQGLGYNRRAIALKRTAERLTAEQVGPPSLPREERALVDLPGIGPATAAGVLAFAFGEPSVYLETNVRTVFLHELWPESDGVPDRDILPLVKRATQRAVASGTDPRTWYYALLDYGAHLKRVLPNPSRRSAHHVRQSPFEGSRRQLRARLVRAVMADPGATADELAQGAGADAEQVRMLLEELGEEGFMRSDDGRWWIA